MKIRSEISEDDEVVAQLAANFTLLALAPYDSWSHEGTPAQMAAFVVAQARKDGRMGFVRDIVLGGRIQQMHQGYHGQPK